MSNWIMINLSAVPAEVAEAQTAQQNHTGACHDGIWTVFTWISSEAEAIAEHYQPLDGVEPMVIIGKHLATKPETPLIAPRSVLSTLYRTPEWRLWCGQYETWQELEIDHVAAFGFGVDGRKSIETLVAEAKNTLFAAMVAG